MQKLEIMRFQVWVRAQQHELHQAIPANPFMRISSASPRWLNRGASSTERMAHAFIFGGQLMQLPSENCKESSCCSVYQAVSSSFLEQSLGKRACVLDTRAHTNYQTRCNGIGVVIHDHIHHIHKCRCDNEGYKSHVSPNMRVRTV